MSVNAFGRKQIKLPLSKENLTPELVASYLPTAIKLHLKNKEEYIYWQNYYKGNQPILQKQTVSNINNIVLINYAFESVEFKKGFVFGDPVQYTKKETSQTDDIDYLNKYLIQENRDEKNRELAENYYITGTGHLMCLPAKNVDDFESNSPFKVYNLDNEDVFVAYSTSISKEPVFACIITQIESESPDTEKFELKCYTDEHILTFEYKGTFGNVTSTTFGKPTIAKNEIGIIPIVEYPLNRSRLGIVELTHTIDNAIHDIISNNIDDMKQFVTALMLFMNVEFDEEDIETAKQLGAISLSTNDPNKPADIKYITKSLQYTEVLSQVDFLEKKNYALRNVPQAAASVTSGGDTGEARKLGGGWTRADYSVDNDVLAFITSERKLLEIILKICKANPKCPIDEINVSDIEIKFNINRSDNLLVKVQSLVELVKQQMPKDIALNIVGLVSDTREVASRWNEEIETQSQKLLEQEQKLNDTGTETEVVTENIESNSTETTQVIE